MKKKTSELRPNKFNFVIYGSEELSLDFIENIRQHGILVPISIKQNGTIISGHRRWQAAKEIGLKEIPVNIVSYKYESDEKQAIIFFNKQRDKTFSQKMNEAEWLEKIERENARERKLFGKKIDHRATLPQGLKGRVSDKVAEQIGIGKRKTYEKARKIWDSGKNNLDIAEKIKLIDSGKTTINKVFQELRLSERKEVYLSKSPNPKIYSEKYTVLMADPPWPYDRDYNGNPNNGGLPYKPMSISDLKKLPVKDITDKDSALFLWATWPKLQEAMQVIESWEFSYVTCAFVWIKLNPSGELLESKNELILKNGLYSGLGSWTNSNSEFCLFAKRGAPIRFKKDIKQVIIAPRTSHSEKPKEIHSRIEKLMGDVPRIELFARKKISGWDVIGNEINKKDIRAELKEIISLQRKLK